MDFGFTTAAYVVAAILFILSLGGLSGQESAKRAVWYGIVGMAIAVLATLVGPGAGLGWLSVILIALGGLIGMQLANRVQMTQMPELVAAMHSLVGLAAVFVGYNAEMTINLVEAAKSVSDSVEGAFAQLVAKKVPIEISILKVELALGIWIGAVTFTGSVVAYGKLSGNSSLLPFKIDTSAKKLPGGHLLNAAAAALSVLFLFMYLGGSGSWTLILLTLLALFIGYHHHFTVQSFLTSLLTCQPKIQAISGVILDNEQTVALQGPNSGQNGSDTG